MENNIAEGGLNLMKNPVLNAADAKFEKKSWRDRYNSWNIIILDISMPFLFGIFLPTSIWI
jgi:hypothetical protein